MTPRGHDPELDKVPCPDCGTDLDVDWVEITNLSQRYPEYVPGDVRCPASPSHDLDAAYPALRRVTVAHPDREEAGMCTAKALDHWRRLGWYPTEPEHQTPTEVVHARVRQLRTPDDTP